MSSTFQHRYSGGSRGAVHARAARPWPGVVRGRVAGRHSVRAESAAYLHGQVCEQMRQAGQIVAGVGGDQQLGGALAPVTCGGDPLDDVAQLGNGDGSGVISRAEPGCVRQAAPGGAARLRTATKE